VRNPLNTNTLKRLAMVMTLSLLLTACEETRYLLVIDNQSGAFISQVEVAFSGVSITTRDLQPGQHETAIFEHPRLGEQLQVQWQNQQGQHRVTFDTYQHIPNAHRRGKVMIQINPDQTAILYYQPPQE
jgi:hypothetical protein